VEEKEVDEESYAKLKSVLDKIKKEISEGERNKADQASQG
jgi:hypothetical protein